MSGLDCRPLNVREINLDTSLFLPFFLNFTPVTLHYLGYFVFIEALICEVALLIIFTFPVRDI